LSPRSAVATTIKNAGSRPSSPPLEHGQAILARQVIANPDIIDPIVETVVGLLQNARASQGRGPTDRRTSWGRTTCGDQTDAGPGRRGASPPVQRFMEPAVLPVQRLIQRQG
jgi:hypothetical protein